MRMGLTMMGGKFFSVPMSNKKKKKGKRTKGYWQKQGWSTKGHNDL